MINQSTQIHPADCKCFFWSPVVSGALVAIGFTFLLNLFSVAIGLTAFSTDSEGVEILAFSGLIASSLGIVVSMFASGWISGYLANRYCNKHHLGALYGFLTWCLALVVMILLSQSMMKYVNLYTHFISGTSVSLAGSHAAVQIAAENIPQTKVVISAYIVFCLFFLGAFASSLGGHYGMQDVYKD